MPTHLYVAAGGGGDALAALLIHHALGRVADQAVVMSYSWDRFLIDAKPGPRSVADFIDLAPVTTTCWRVTAKSKLPWPAAPTLPLLARLTDAQMILLDPHGGAAVMRRCITELAEAVNAKEVTMVDVGGDAIAVGHEPTLLSPLADSLALAALTGVKRPVSVVVAGPGLDGELSAEYSERRCRQTATHSITITREAVASQREALRQHPSEATALLSAAALGARGSVEVRDHGSLVSMTDTSAIAHVIPHDRALETNQLAQRLATTTSLHEAEEITLAHCGRCELTYERHKASKAAARQQKTDVQLVNQLDAYREVAAARGATHGTFRRLSEVLGLPRYEPERLRALVKTAHPYLPLYPL